MVMEHIRADTAGDDERYGYRLSGGAIKLAQLPRPMIVQRQPILGKYHRS